jgi:hypothetical protein
MVVEEWGISSLQPTAVIAGPPLDSHFMKKTIKIDSGGIQLYF